MCIVYYEVISIIKKNYIYVIYISSCVCVCLCVCVCVCSCYLLFSVSVKGLAACSCIPTVGGTASFDPTLLISIYPFMSLNRPYFTNFNIFTHVLFDPTLLISIYPFMSLIRSYFTDVSYSLL